MLRSNFAQISLNPLKAEANFSLPNFWLSETLHLWRHAKPDAVSDSINRADIHAAWEELLQVAQIIRISHLNLLRSNVKCWLSAAGIQVLIRGVKTPQDLCQVCQVGFKHFSIKFILFHGTVASSRNPWIPHFSCILDYVSSWNAKFLDNCHSPIYGIWVTINGANLDIKIVISSRHFSFKQNWNQAVLTQIHCAPRNS